MMGQASSISERRRKRPPDKLPKKQGPAVYGNPIHGKFSAK
jgi:hypothetical protein